MDVLVTGANGFAGRHVCQRLVATGHTVRGAVRSQDAAAALPNHVEPYLVGDIETFHGWPAAVDGAESVVHLIARTHVIKEYENDPLARYRAVNVEGTRRLLEACREASVRRFLYVSSIKAVGEGADHAYCENDPCRPEDAYGVSKLEAEEVVRQLGRELDLEPVIVRPPLVYGAGVGGNFLRMLRVVERGLPLPVGSVRNVRSMVFVENLASAVETCLTSPAASGETFHVADDRPLDTPTLVRLLAKYLNRPARLISVPASLLRLTGALTNQQGQVSRLTGSLTVSTKKIERLLGWHPPVSVADGIRRTVAGYQRGDGSSHPTAAQARAA
ncbi:MAG: NAD-dependent epimerase/dehydratase family protein [Burkholderiales bacterium]|nr:NAD-dependent epimerase/dehydratase family protein [Burkholderiales bacterium]